MRCRALTWSFGLALSALACVFFGVLGIAHAGKIDANAIRLAQIGVLKDFKNLLSAELLKQLVEFEALQVSQRKAGADFSPQFQAGDTFELDSFPELAKIRFLKSSGEEDFCTGWFLQHSVDRTRVLTAAHCSCGRLDTYQVYKGDDLTRFKDFTYVLAAPPDRYSDYSCDLFPEQQIGKDLALLHVRHVERKDLRPEERPVGIVTAKIASMHQVYLDRATTRLVGVGFGETEKEREPRRAVAAIIPITSYFCSAGGFAQSACAPFREFVLADLNAKPGVTLPDSCGGDSGSPIFWASPPAAPKTISYDTGRFLVGITSRALAGVQHNRRTACGGGGVYTAVGHPDVVRWLASHGVLAQSDPTFKLRDPKDP